MFILSVSFYLFANHSTASTGYKFNRTIGNIFTPTSGNYLVNFNYPSSLFFDSGQNLYVSDFDKLIKFKDAETTDIKKVIQQGNIIIIRSAIDHSDNIYLYILDIQSYVDLQSYEYHIFKYDSSGNFLLEVGSSGTGDGQITDYIADMAVDSQNNLFVAHGGSYNKVQKFDPSGNFVIKFGTSGTGHGQFNWPYGIAIDGNDNIYVADYYNNRIEKFASTTAYLSTISTPGYTPGPLAIDNTTGDTYAFDDGSKSILRYDSNGNFINLIPQLGVGDAQIQSEFPGITIGPDGNIYVTDMSPGSIKVFDRVGNFIRKYSSVDLLTSQQDGYIRNSYGIALDEAGNIYVADYYNNRIQKFDQNGNFISKFGTQGTGDGQLNYPYGVALDSSGNLYVSDYSNRIQKFNSSGTFISNIATSGSSDGQVSYPSDIFIDSGDNLYVADSNNHRIQKFDSNGNFVMKFGSNGSGDGQFIYPTSVTTDRYGNLFVVDTYNNRIQKFDNNGNFLMKFGTYGSDNGELEYPSDILIDSSDYIYVSDTKNDSVQIFNSSGAYVGKLGTFGFSQDKFNSPTAIALDSHNNLYISQLYNNFISVYSPASLNITSIQSSPTETGATITWTSSDPASSQVEFGPSSSFGSTTPITNTSPLVSNHSVTISNLPSCSTFQYRVISTSTAVTTRSTSSSFTTLGCTGTAEVVSQNDIKASSTATSTVSLEVLSLAIPPSVSTSSEVVFQAKKLEPTAFFQEAKTPAGQTAIGTSVFNLVAIDTQSANKISTFQAPIAVSVTYSPSDLSGVDPNTLTIYRYDNNSWYPLSNCSTNTDTYTVTCYTSNFSDFALFAVPKPAGGAAYYVTPGDLDSGTAKAEAVKIQAEAVKLSANNDTPIKQAIESLNKTTILLTNNLSLGLFSKEVSLLQAYLATMPNIYPEALVTGYYGKLTQKAVQRYQCARNIICQGTPNSTGWGVVGPRTRGEVGR